MKSGKTHKTAPQPAESEAALRAELAAVRKIGDEMRRAEALEALVPRLRSAGCGDALFPEALAVMKTISKDTFRARGIAARRGLIAAVETESHSTVEKEITSHNAAFRPALEPPPVTAAAELADAAKLLSWICSDDEIGSSAANREAHAWLKEVAPKIFGLTESESLVDNCETPSDTPPMPQPVITGDATSTEWVTVRVEKRRWEALEKEVASGAASPAVRAIVEAGMVACGRVSEDEAKPAPLSVRPAAAETTRSAPPLSAFGVSLLPMNQAQREAALKKYYPKKYVKDGEKIKRTTWTEARGNNTRPTPKMFLEWLGESYPDRREVGVVLSDMKFLDKSAYDKALNWSKTTSGISREIIASFGLPSKMTKYDLEQSAAAFAEVTSALKMGTAPRPENLKIVKSAARRGLNHAEHN
jgi:hypothetical protein